MSQVQRRAPSRMSLSPTVGKSTIPQSKKRRAVKTAGPFRGMNLREAQVRMPLRDRSNSLAGSRDSQNRSGVKGVHRKSGTKSGQASEYRVLRMHRALAQVPYGQRSTVKSRISEVDSFEQFRLLPVVRDSVYNQALKGQDDVGPTPIQRLAIPALLQADMAFKKRYHQNSKPTMNQFLLAAETGSGKTLAYLLPTIDALKRAEVAEAETENLKEDTTKAVPKRTQLSLEAPPLSNASDPTSGRPRAIVLLPTSELVSQVGGIGKLLSHTVRYRAALISSAYSGTVIRNRLFSPAGIDILFTTPHLLINIAEADPNVLSRVTHLIVDEADSLLDRSFAPLTSAIIDRSTPSLKQLVLCSATIPRSLDSYLHHRFPEMVRLVTPNLHAIPRRVQLSVVDVDKDPYHGSKNLACADTIYSIGRSAAEHAMSHVAGRGTDRSDVKRIIVFVNEREVAVEVANYLVSKGIRATALNRDTSEQRQSEVLAHFTSSSTTDKVSSNVIRSSPKVDNNRHPLASSSYQPAVTFKRSLPNTRVLVMTDIGSRGIDTLAVRHVILYDVPHTTVDFIHRLGRTGRMGRRGRGIVLVNKNDRKDVVKEVREGMYRGQALV